MVRLRVDWGGKDESSCRPIRLLSGDYRVDFRVTATYRRARHIRAVRRPQLFDHASAACGIGLDCPGMAAVRERATIIQRWIELEVMANAALWVEHQEAQPVRFNPAPGN